MISCPVRLELRTPDSPDGAVWLLRLGYVAGAALCVLVLAVAMRPDLFSMHGEPGTVGNPAPLAFRASESLLGRR
jgi:hypothetical protein